MAESNILQIPGNSLTCFCNYSIFILVYTWQIKKTMSEELQRQKLQTTIRDIAREADVSISTVSRVLNDHPHVDSHTRPVRVENGN